MELYFSNQDELYNNDITISYVAFVIKDSLFTQDGKDYFIMDFKY